MDNLKRDVAMSHFNQFCACVCDLGEEEKTRIHRSIEPSIAEIHFGSLAKRYSTLNVIFALYRIFRNCMIRTGLRKKEFWNTTYRTASRCAKCIRISRPINDNITLKGGMYSQNVNNTSAWSNLVNK